MIWVIIIVGLVVSLFGAAYIHDEIYFPHKQHLKKPKKSFDDQKRQYEHNIFQDHSVYYWEPSIQKMNSKTFISTYPLMKKHLNIYPPVPNADIYCYSFRLLNPKEEKIYFLTFDFIDYWKVHKFCDELERMKKQEEEDKEKIKNHADEVEMYEFLQSLCQDKMKQAQKEIEVACDDIKKITLRVNGIEEN